MMAQRSIDDWLKALSDIHEFVHGLVFWVTLSSVVIGRSFSSVVKWSGHWCLLFWATVFFCFHYFFSLRHISFRKWYCNKTFTGYSGNLMIWRKHGLDGENHTNLQVPIAVQLQNHFVELYSGPSVYTVYTGIIEISIAYVYV